MGGWWKHETNIYAGREAGRVEALYVLICDSWKSCKSPRSIGEFLYAFFYISHHFCVPCLFRCYALSSEVNFTLSLTFYLSNLFYILPSTHFTPLMSFFFAFPSTFLFSQVNLNVSILYTSVLHTLYGVVVRDRSHTTSKTSKVRTVGRLLLSAVHS